MCKIINTNPNPNPNTREYVQEHEASYRIL